MKESTQMAKMLKFTKMHSLGNDFMLVDGLSQEAAFNVSEIKSWSNRNTGIGFDQLLVVEPPESPDSDFSFAYIMPMAQRLSSAVMAPVVQRGSR